MTSTTEPEVSAAPGDVSVPAAVASLPARLARVLAIDRLSGLYTWLALVVVFSILVPDTFLTVTTARSIGMSAAVTAIVALALIAPLACGLFDLSVAATLSVAAVLSLKLQAAGMPAPVAVVLSLAVGAVIGAANGLLVVRVGISSFIATLGVSSILLALAYGISGGVQIVAPPGSDYVAVGQSAPLGVPFPVWCALAVAAALFYVTQFTTTGRYLYAIGGNAEAARLVGVRVDRHMFGSLVASATIAAGAGVVLSAQLGATTDQVGPPYLLPAFSAVLLGATQVTLNGRVNVLGTLIAVLLLATGIFGLQLVGAPPFVSNLFNGAALLVAVALSVHANRRRLRAAT